MTLEPHQASGTKAIRVLLVEDRATDAEIVMRELRRAGFELAWTRVETEPAYQAQLHGGIDLVLSDYALPHFSGLRALELLKERGLEIPFVIVSGTIGEETAVAAMKLGATDYLLKDRLGRLGSAVGQALEQGRLRREGRQTEKALKLFRALVDNSNDAFEVIDPPTGRFLDVSERGCAALGYTREELLERHVWDVAATLPAERWPAIVAQTRQLGSVRAEGLHLRKDRTTYPIEVSLKLVQFDREYLVAVVRDVTERKRAEESLRQSEERFRQAQKMEAIGTLAGGIAHDFNNILSGINGYAELARMSLGNGNPEAAECLDAIMQGGKRAATLVRRILTFSRKQEPQRTPLRLREVVEETLNLLRSTLPATIEFKTSLAVDLPLVLADSTQIHQVLMNLGTNAAHAMNNRPGTLGITLENFDVDSRTAEAQPCLRIGRFVRLTVSDTGSGMDRATQERIFEPFFTTKEPGEGTGLGLSVVYGIVQSHEGAITVFSQPGEGTRFQLYFPAYSGEALAPISEDEPLPRGRGQHILFVDDEEPLARLGKKILEELGYQAEMSTNPVHALNLVRADPRRFDLVISDQTMPRMTGIDLAGELLKIRPDLPFILTSGNAERPTAQELQTMGIRQYIRKPRNIRSVATAVHRALTEAFSP